MRSAFLRHFMPPYSRSENSSEAAPPVSGHPPARSTPGVEGVYAPVRLQSGSSVSIRSIAGIASRPHTAPRSAPQIAALVSVSPPLMTVSTTASSRFDELCPSRFCAAQTFERCCCGCWARRASSAAAGISLPTGAMIPSRSQEGSGAWISSVQQGSGGAGVRKPETSFGRARRRTRGDARVAVQPLPLLQAVAAR